MINKKPILPSLQGIFWGILIFLNLVFMIMFFSNSRIVFNNCPNNGSQTVK